MTFLLAVSAAAGCAVANGVSAVLQKIGADKAKTSDRLQFSLLFKLSRNIPYVVGILLDLVGWLLILVAVRILPLFLVQTIIAASVVVTVLADRLILHTRLNNRVYAAIALVLLGLVLVGSAASPEASRTVSHLVRLCVLFAPIPILLLGFALSRFKQRSATIGLAALGGVAFGATSVVGRMLPHALHFQQLIRNGLIWALISYGVLGLLLFTTALQRASATTANAVMISCDTLFPALFGIVFFGDTVRHGLWVPALLGAALTLAGSLIIALQPESPKPRHT